MDKKRINSLAIGLFIVWLAFISVFRANLGSGVRIFNDDYDRAVYSIRGEWLLNGQVPYLDVPSEYPQVATVLFAVPYLFTSHPSVEAYGYWLHSSIFSLIMLGFLGGTIILLYRMLPTHKSRAYLMLLPASLYFAYNRFDILPSFLVLLSLYFLQRKWDVFTGIVLAIAALTKWYPVLLFPIFYLYIYNTRRRLDWKMTLAFGLTCIGIILPTFLTSGLQGVLQPYAFHASRAIEFAALPAFIQSILVGWFGSGISLTLFPTIFLALSVLPVPLSVFVRIDSFDKVMYWSILVLTSFILFSRIWSPQWMLWLLPLLILTARTPRHIFCIIVYGIVNYLAFPLVYDLSGQESWLLRVVVFASYLLLIYTSVVAYRGMKETSPLPGSFVLETSEHP
jgi:hypothetical protein